MILNYNTQKQILTQWCWAAVSSSISMCFDAGSIFNQQEIATKVLGIDCSAVSGTNIPDGVNIVETLSDALRATGNYRDETPITLSLSEVISEINNNNPVGCQIRWDSLNLAHFVCIFGYDDDTFDLHVGDPELPRVYVIPYDDFVSNYRGGHWQATIYTKSA